MGTATGAELLVFETNVRNSCTLPAECSFQAEVRELVKATEFVRNYIFKSSKVINYVLLGHAFRLHLA